MEITRKSEASGIVRTRDLGITQEQYDLYLNGVKVQDAFPHLSADDREFIMTGITAEEWNELFNFNGEFEDSQLDEAPF
jgi:hypothetical protein